MNDIKIQLINDLLRKKEEFSFNEFLFKLRQYHGYSRPFVQSHTGIHEVRLFHIEYGTFKRRLKDLEIIMLSRFYHLDPKELKDMAEKHYNRAVLPKRYA